MKDQSLMTINDKAVIAMCILPLFGLVFAGLLAGYVDWRSKNPPRPKSEWSKIAEPKPISKPRYIELPEKPVRETYDLSKIPIYHTGDKVAYNGQTYTFWCHGDYPVNCVLSATPSKYTPVKNADGGDKILLTDIRHGEYYPKTGYGHPSGRWKL